MSIHEIFVKTTQYNSSLLFSRGSTLITRIDSVIWTRSKQLTLNTRMSPYRRHSMLFCACFTLGIVILFCAAYFPYLAYPKRWFDATSVR